MPIRITGLNSGLDTESIISALVSAYSYKTNKYKKAQTKLAWKQDAWKTLNSKIYSFYNNVGNMKLSSAYNMKTATISDTTKASVTASSKAVNGSYSIQVTQLAKTGYLTGGQLSSGVTSSTKMSQLGFSGKGKITIGTGSSSKDITVSADTTVSEFITNLKEAGVNASYDKNNRRFYISAKESGAANDLTLTGADAKGTELLNDLKLSVVTSSDTKAYKDLNNEYYGQDFASIRDAKKTATNTVTNLTAKNQNYNSALSYARALNSVNQVASLATDAAKKDDYNQMVALAQKASLTNVWVDNDGTLYNYDESTRKYTNVKEYTGGSYNEATGEYTDADGNVITGGVYNDNGTYTVTKEALDTENLMTADAKLQELAIEFGMSKTETVKGKDGSETTKTVADSDALNTFKKNLSTVSSLGSLSGNNTELGNLIKEIDDTNAAGGTTDVATKISEYESAVSTNEAEIASANQTLSEYSQITATMTDNDLAALQQKVDYAHQVATGSATIASSAGATRIEGQDATIYVNGAEYTGSTNNFSINGLTINATGVTGSSYDATEQTAVNVTVNTDTQGIYDKIKDMLTQYNSLINEITSLYNADSAKGYEPLTDDEKDALSDSEVEKWEEKIKSSLLRRDDTLESVMNGMTAAMSKSYTINGKSYSLSTFGISTLGFLNAAENEQYAYHIDGDEDDSATSGKSDKLMAAITADPDTVVSFMQQLSQGLYKSIDAKMKTSTLSSVYKVYNDKEMASEYSDYTTLISKWEDKLQEKEDYYYKKFSSMETALSKLNSQTSSLSNILGS